MGGVSGVEVADGAGVVGRGSVLFRERGEVWGALGADVMERGGGPGYGRPAKPISML